MSRKDKILNFINSDNYTPMRKKDISVLLGVPKDAKDILEKILIDLENEGEIFLNNKGQYESVKHSGLLRGEFELSPKGYGFINIDDTKYYINKSSTHGAYHKDIVLFKVTHISKNEAYNNEGKIVKIISHTQKGIVGTFKKSKNFGFVVPDNKSFGDIYIPKKHCDNVSDGQKVVAKITIWPTKDKNAQGYIEEVIGYENDKNVDIKCIEKEFDIISEFPKKVLLSALSFGDKVYDEEKEGRLDLRDNLIFTIDGDDAKDFDDAVEIEKTPSGYKLGVHIADVSYYVSENSAIDIEAQKRGTSIYFPGHVIPMLPTHLSDNLCSLVPNEDRLALSVIIDLDNDANVKSYEIKESVIKSKYRLTYNEVNKMLTNDKETLNKYKEVTNTIFIMKELKDKLKAKRLKNSIDFDFPEAKIILDENSKVKDIYKTYQSDAHSLIEEFMLITNVCVAEKCFYLDLPFVYRIHEKPSYDKITTFSKFAGLIGLKLKCNADNPNPSSFNAILNEVKGTNKEALISKVMLRSLMKAKYSDFNEGHFGLGFPIYCHFTSPIRRYPDLMVHRIIKEHMKYSITQARERFLRSFVKKHSLSSSNAELKAMKAQRYAEDMKKAEFMENKIGERFSAYISSITSYGIYLETEFCVEGLVNMTDLDDDYYEFDEKTLQLIGKKTKRVFSIGDKYNIIVKKADKKTARIDFILDGSDLDG